LKENQIPRLTTDKTMPECDSKEIFMRCVLASSLSFLLMGSVLLVASPALAQAGASDLQGKADNHQDPSTYRGKTLSFYLAQAKTPSLRADAMRSVGSFGPQAASALPQLISALQDSDGQVRIAAAWAISQVAPSTNEATVKALERALSDTDPRVRSIAAVALRQIGPGAADAIPQLIACLDDPVAFVRAPAADALGAIGPAARPAVAPLSKRLLVKDEQVFVLRSMAYALGNIGPDARSAIPALEEALKMVRVSYAAQSAILKIKGLPVPSY
jgi:HEAT repeat protein